MSGADCAPVGFEASDVLCGFVKEYALFAAWWSCSGPVGFHLSDERTIRWSESLLFGDPLSGVFSSLVKSEVAGTISKRV